MSRKMNKYVEHRKLLLQKTQSQIGLSSTCRIHIYHTFVLDCLCFVFSSLPVFLWKSPKNSLLSYVEKHVPLGDLKRKIKLPKI